MSGHGELEETFARWCIEAATRLGWHVLRTHDSRRSPEGEPDFRVVPVRNGRAAGRRMMWWELKRLGEGPSPAQIETMADLRAAGEEVYLLYTSDRDLALQLLSMPGDRV